MLIAVPSTSNKLYRRAPPSPPLAEEQVDEAIAKGIVSHSCRAGI